ncbi:MAG: hypothetical protein ABWZ25_12210 [Chitinophagaceae bacterium]
MVQHQRNNYPLQKSLELAERVPAIVKSPEPATIPGQSRIIEMIGSPGAGKSTIYNELIRSWDPDCPWEYRQQTKKAGSLEKVIRAITGRRATEPVVIEGGLDFINHHPDLAEFLWAHLSDARTYPYNSYNKRFRSAYFLFRDFCRYQTIMQGDSEKFFVVDEGLLQRSFLVNNDRTLMEEIVSEYIELIPLPSAIIYLEARNLDVIFARLKGRKKTIASHIGLTDWELYKDLETWQYLFSLINEKLKKKNVEIFRIDSEEQVDTNVALIKDHLRSLTNLQRSSENNRSI